jgi:hypothetical protein
MQKTGVRRLLLLSKAAYGTHHGGIGNRIIAGVYGAVSAPAITERRRQDDIVLASGLDWTIVRPRVISDKPAGSPLSLRLDPRGTLTGRTSLTAVTSLLLAVIDNPKPIAVTSTPEHQAPAVQTRWFSEVRADGTGGRIRAGSPSPRASRRTACGTHTRRP